jgi:hypothetical protein
MHGKDENSFLNRKHEKENSIEKENRQLIRKQTIE